MASAKKAWGKFMRAIATAPAGTPFEVGDTWTQHHGWRPYQRIGDKLLMMSPAQARGLYTTFEKLGSEPQWRGTWESMKDTFDQLKAAADDCDRKNRDRYVPPGAVKHWSAEGSA